MTVKEELLQFFEEKQIPCEVRHGDKKMPEDIHILIDGDNGKWEGIGLCYEEDRLFVFYVNLGVLVPKERREKMSAWLLEKNFSYKCGGFFMDPDTGTLITRTSLYVYGSPQEQRNLIEQAVYTSAIIAENEYLEVMQKVFTEE